MYGTAWPGNTLNVARKEKVKCKAATDGFPSVQDLLAALHAQTPWKPSNVHQQAIVPSIPLSAPVT